MDIGRALTYVFQDAAWARKFLIGVGLLLLPNLLSSVVSAGSVADGFQAQDGLPVLVLGLLGLVAGFAVYGYGLRIARQVAAGTDLPLPEWAAWGRLFVDGFKAFVVALIWFLVPAILVAVVFFGFWLGVLAGDGDGGNSGAVGLGALLGCLTLLFFLALYVVFPAALTRLATTGSIGEAVNLPAVFSLVRANFGDYVVILLLQVVVGLVLGTASFAISFAVGAATGGAEAGAINWPAAVVSALFSTAVGLYLGAFACHLYGQAYYRANRGPVLPAGAGFGQIN